MSRRVRIINNFSTKATRAELNRWRTRELLEKSEWMAQVSQPDKGKVVADLQNEVSGDLLLRLILCGALLYSTDECIHARFCFFGIALRTFLTSGQSFFAFYTQLGMETTL